MAGSLPCFNSKCFRDSVCSDNEISEIMLNDFDCDFPYDEDSIEAIFAPDRQTNSSVQNIVCEQPEPIPSTSGLQNLHHDDNLREFSEENIQETDNHTSRPTKRQKISVNNDNVNYNITWTDDSFTPVLHDFNSNYSGIQLEILEDSDFASCFKLFLTPEIIEIISVETNRYYQQVTNDVVLTPSSNLRKWKLRK